jgi:hypothetical protein
MNLKQEVKEVTEKKRVFLRRRMLEPCWSDASTDKERRFPNRRGASAIWKSPFLGACESICVLYCCVGASAVSQGVGFTRIIIAAPQQSTFTVTSALQG